MAKKESTLVNMLVSLLVIAAVSGGIIGLVYGITKDKIDEVEKLKNETAMSEVLKKEGQSIKEFKADTVDGIVYNMAYDADGKCVGAAVKSFTNKGFSGKIELMVGLLADGTINKVSVLSQNETPGLGANMTNAKFKDQFNGKNPDDGYKLQVKKDGGDVDAITAATISSRAFSDAVKTACDGFKANKERLMKGGNDNE